MAGLACEGRQLPGERRGPSVERRVGGGRAGNGPLEGEHPDLGAGVARGHGLAVRPDAEHRIAPARVELSHHAHPHRSAVDSGCVRTVWSAVVLSTNGRPARKRRASSIASSDE